MLVIRSESQLGGEGKSSAFASSIGAGLVMKPPGGPSTVADDLANEFRQGFATKPHSDSGRGSGVASSSLGCSGGGDRSKVKCSHYRNFCHSIEECYQLVVYQEGWRFNRRLGSREDPKASEVAKIEATEASVSERRPRLEKEAEQMRNATEY